MNGFTIKVVVALIFFSLPWACKYNDDLWNRGSDKIDGDPPAVSYFDPGDGTSDSGITVAFSIRFDDDMMHGTLNSSTIAIEEGGTVPVVGSWSYDLVDVTNGQQTIARFTPTGGLFKRGTAYTLTVSTDVRDYYGNYLATEYSGGFSTAAGLELEASSVDVDTDGANHRIRLTFNDPPTDGWRVSVYDSDGNLAVLATPVVFDGSSTGVSASEDSRYIVIPTGVAFNPGADVSVTAFTAFSAAIDSAAFADPGTVTIIVPTP